MEKNDREKILKRLKIFSTILMVIMIIAAALLLYRVSDYVQESNYRKSKYYDYSFKSLDTNYAKYATSNFIFEGYEGKQTGSQLKYLIVKLMNSAKTFEGEDASQLPKLEYRRSNGEVMYSDDRIDAVTCEEPSEKKSLKKIFLKYDYDEFERRIKWEEEAEKQDKIISEKLTEDEFKSYLKGVSGISGKIDSKQTYEVEFKYKWDHVIDTVIISE